MLQALTTAVEKESPESSAYPYLLGAALTLKADAEKAATWRSKLEKVLFTGTMDARYEASHTLVLTVQRSEIPRLVPLLDDPGKDTQVGAAQMILAASK